VEFQNKVVRTLLGHQHFDLSMKCLGTARRFNRDPFGLVVHDDGTLTERELDGMQRLLAPTTVVRRAEADEMVLAQLKNYPACARFREEHPLAMKLFDVALLGEGEIAAIDSDVCFFRPFRRLFTFPDEQTGAVFMRDFQNAYALRSFDYWPIGDFRVPCRANTGIIHFRRRDYDLDFLERMLWQYGPAMTKRMAWWVEQTCWAALGGRARCRVLDLQQFSVAREVQSRSPTTIGLHFVGASRHLFDEAYAGLDLNASSEFQPVDVLTQAAGIANGVTLAARFGWMVVTNKVRRLLDTANV
jgi:hypothetical protein